MAELPEARVVQDKLRLRLQPAPRKLPFILEWRLLYGTGLSGPFCWFFGFFTTMAAFLFLSEAELVKPDYDRTGIATITDVEATDEDNRPIEIKSVYYTFVDDNGTKYDGVSFTKWPPTGGTHRVEWVAADPTKSRLVGMRARPYGPAAAIILIFPAIGLGLVAWQVVSGLGKRRLLRYGLETRGKLVAKSETSIHVDNKPMFELTFEYEVGGRTYRFTVETNNPSRLVDDEQEPMLYDPRRPEHATTLDNLPGGPKITDNGRILAKSRITVLEVVFPLGIIAAIVGTLMSLR